MEVNKHSVWFDAAFTLPGRTVTVRPTILCFLGNGCFSVDFHFLNRKGAKSRCSRACTKEVSSAEGVQSRRFTFVFGLKKREKLKILLPLTQWGCISILKERTSQVSSNRQSGHDESVLNYYTARRPWFPPTSWWHYWKLVLKMTSSSTLWDMKLLNEASWTGVQKALAVHEGTLLIAYQ